MRGSNVPVNMSVCTHRKDGSHGNAMTSYLEPATQGLHHMPEVGLKGAAANSLGFQQTDKH